MSDSKKPKLSKIRAWMTMHATRDMARAKLLYEGVPYLFGLVEGMGKEFDNWECPVCGRFLDRPYVDCSFCKKARALLEELKQ